VPGECLDATWLADARVVASARPMNASVTNATIAAAGA
jgi:hypothetical protein